VSTAFLGCSRQSLRINLMRRVSTFLLACAPLLLAVATDRPIIGILALPLTSPVLDRAQDSQRYIAASYVKWVEAAGARVVPLFYDYSEQHIQTLLSRLNGVLLTGGDDLASNSPYFRTVASIVRFSEEASKRNRVFPVWGTCLGMETLIRYFARDPDSILHKFDAENISLPLKFSGEEFAGEMFARTRYASRRIRYILEYGNVSINNHVWGVSPKDLIDSPGLSDNFRLLATSLDRQGKEFVSLIEGKKFPIYGSQFHPEKPLFEWYPEEDINHSPDTRDSMQYFANFFVDMTRLSTQSFGSRSQEQCLMIYNYDPKFTGKVLTSSFEQLYVFDPDDVERTIQCLKDDQATMR